MDEGATGSRGVEGVREGVEAKGMETGQMERVRETLETRQGQGTTRKCNVCCGRSLTKLDRITMFGETGWRAEASHEDLRPRQPAEAQATLLWEGRHGESESDGRVEGNMAVMRGSGDLE